MKDRRYWLEVEGRQVRVPGVTTILKQIGWSSGGLMYWAWQQGYDGNTLEEAREKATSVGTVVHAMIEADVRGFPVPDITALNEEQQELARTSYSAWESWKSRTEFHVESAELKLVSETRKFGGTLDLALVQGRLGIMDFKTANALYPDNLCQIAAYGQLYKECNGQDVQEYHLIRLSKEDGSFHHHCWPARAMEPAWEAFRHARQLYELEKRLKGQL